MFPEYVDNPNVHLSQASFLVLSDIERSRARTTPNNSLTRRSKFNMGYIPTVVGSFNESLNNLINKMNE